MGKSTILKLICGFYNLSSGKIRIFGNDIRDVNLKSVRKFITYMSQESYLYPITISENIAVGKENASMEEIICAAKLANAHEFIEKLPNGYDTLIGEGGGGISGGQCQRIALARMILKDAPIVLLDEPTAALDAKAEAILSESLEKITKNKTIIVVAHKLATIKNASNIIVFDKNGIIEMGTHRKLMENKGIYKRLYESSFGADKGDLAI
ncbi:ATP-binding cassette domain-containing protein [Clostridium sp. DMHC 10]|uniref:ATP-binding cassette domain-containing protein n=1 Tax=Clostridium sp. DMHC 10 TaxID=747377 RepID=UPI001FA7E5E0|nr:ATP-binding cassette domain-containing protein [Clostridium sp. DMHC 10]